MGPSIYRPMNSWAHEFIRPWIHGPIGSWAHEFMVIMGYHQHSRCVDLHAYGVPSTQLKYKCAKHMRRKMQTKTNIYTNIYIYIYVYTYKRDPGPRRWEGTLFPPGEPTRMIRPPGGPGFRLKTLVLFHASLVLIWRPKTILKTVQFRSKIKHKPNQKHWLGTIFDF